jgi:adenylate cyclase
VAKTLIAIAINENLHFRISETWEPGQATPPAFEPAMKPESNPVPEIEPEKIYAGPFGQLTPVGGGDPIPLIKERLLVGRRGQVDIQLNFPNVSSQHCRLTLEHGYWFVKDLNSRNGTKVDNRAVMRKRADPGSKISIAKHQYVIEYEPQSLGAYGPPPADDDYMEEVLKSSLMDRAGISKRKGQR